MKALYLALLAGALFTGKAQAGTEVYEVSRGSGTVYSVIFTTTAVVQLDSVVESRFTKGRFEIEIYNEDDTDVLRCGFSVNVSTVAPTLTAASPNFGRAVRPRTGIAWKVPDSVKVYCRVEGTGTGGAATTAAGTITQL